MQKPFLFLFTFVLLSCSDAKTEDSKTLTSSVENKVENKALIPIGDTLSSQSKQITTLQEYLDEFEWGEDGKDPRPTKSFIRNFPFDKSLLLQKWKFPEYDQAIFEFNVDSFNEYDLCHIYSVNHDSIRIYTRAERSGGGVFRGIIRHLTKDSLVIEWSANSKNVYLRYAE